KFFGRIHFDFRRILLNSYGRPASIPTETARQLPILRFPSRQHGSPVPGARDFANHPVYERAASQTAASLPDTHSSSSKNKIPRVKRFELSRNPREDLREDLSAPLSVADRS